jgi:16S rRNA (cytosine1402-N4)-methyltransferase
LRTLGYEPGKASLDDAPQGEHGPEHRHVPVLLEETIRFLNPQPGARILDATLGLGGHASAIAKAIGSGGELLGFDRDPVAFDLAQQRLQQLGAEAPKLTLYNAAFSQMASQIAPYSLDGLLADFGMSSLQLDDAARGFSFQAEGPLDMRMDTRSGDTAEQVVNQAGEKELADLIYEFGEERRSRRIARAIVRARPITTTAQLAQVVSAAAPAMKPKKGRHTIHPATRTFQALRIRVNHEVEEIEALLRTAPQLLKRGGRLVVISFHSLEDRPVKDALRLGAQQGVWQVLTRKPVTAGELETETNPRSRSAKLRAAERM